MTSARAVVATEPEFLRERDAAAFLAVSVRTIAILRNRGEISPVRVPGMRRLVYRLADLRAVAQRWCDQSRIA